MQRDAFKIQCRAGSIQFAGRAEQGVHAALHGMLHADSLLGAPARAGPAGAPTCSSHLAVMSNGVLPVRGPRLRSLMCCRLRISQQAWQS